MLEDVLPLLVCPHCRRPLRRDGGPVRCAGGHSFDVARQGYVSLLAGDAGAGTGDTAAMVAARREFLAAGHYEPLRRSVAAAVAAALATSPDPAPEGRGPALLDVGAGTGHYLAGVLQALAPSPAVGVALDLSKHAARAAARAHPRIGAVVADAWQPLPVADDSVDVVLDVFAPRNAAEVARVLRPGGALVVAVPTPAHLAELVARPDLRMLTVDPRKDDRLTEQLAQRFALAQEDLVEIPLRLDRTSVGVLVVMGPTAHHLPAGRLQAVLDELPETSQVTASVRVRTYHLR